ncbi:hypothetical protein B0A55_04144 [Friedmanniomyces simplex]|uniref:Uncharacterized protein n=1 Tax=Friedmanniomyces simplex TaxID=329884 RepID=A0A4U0XUE2_9PEZI|nr:hypothetical protein B0A55_04144 [Friedmanniomyces simplex]
MAEDPQQKPAKRKTETEQAQDDSKSDDRQDQSQTVMPMEVHPESQTEAPKDAPSESQTVMPMEVHPENQTEAPKDAPSESETEAPKEAHPENQTEAPEGAPPESETEAKEAPSEHETSMPEEAPPETQKSMREEAPSESQTEAPEGAPPESETEAPKEAPDERETSMPEEARQSTGTSRKDELAAIRSDSSKKKNKKKKNEKGKQTASPLSDTSDNETVATVNEHEPSTRIADQLGAQKKQPGQLTPNPRWDDDNFDSLPLPVPGELLSEMREAEYEALRKKLDGALQLARELPPPDFSQASKKFLAKMYPKFEGLSFDRSIWTRACEFLETTYEHARDQVQMLIDAVDHLVDRHQDRDDIVKQLSALNQELSTVSDRAAAQYLATGDELGIAMGSDLRTFIDKAAQLVDAASRISKEVKAARVTMYETSQSELQASARAIVKSEAKSALEGVKQADIDKWVRETMTTWQGQYDKAKTQWFNEQHVTVHALSDAYPMLKQLATEASKMASETQRLFEERDLHTQSQNEALEETLKEFHERLSKVESRNTKVEAKLKKYKAKLKSKKSKDTQSDAEDEVPSSPEKQPKQRKKDKQKAEEPEPDSDDEDEGESLSDAASKKKEKRR